ncbi:MAG: GIY-YIG nuclease family protein [Candidatus Latescibacteria bacterium]|nr:GIY-YIG nuclease family protein [Candidatus Latescibacterota bacterium]
MASYLTCRKIDVVAIPGLPFMNSTETGTKRIRLFDRKFGENLIIDLPQVPAVYLFKDKSDTIMYVGKAKNIRRRLQQYRNASRRKIHRKMRGLVRDASSLEVRIQNSEREALLLENQLIRELHPPYNVDGTYGFLYPAIGIHATDRQALLCFTTDIDAWSDLNLRWYGVFRSRIRAQAAFRALVYLLGLVGHLERVAHLPPHARIRGSRLTGFRRLSPDLIVALERYLSGDENDVLVPLARDLLEKPRARRDASEVQENLRLLLAFHRKDLVPLRKALVFADMSGAYVSQEHRDSIFLASDSRYE